MLARLSVWNQTAPPLLAGPNANAADTKAAHREISEMNKHFTIGAALLLLGTGIVGCSNTAEGAKEDTKDAGTAVQKTGEKAVTAVDNGAKAAGDNLKKAGEDTAAAAKDAGTAVQKTGEKAVAGTEKAVGDAGKTVAGAGEAAVTTPMVATAIDKDSELGNTSMSKINVDTKDGKVILRGHVKTNEMKKKAETIAKKTLTDNKRTEPVVNQIMVDMH